MKKYFLAIFFAVVGLTSNVYACCGGGGSLEEGLFWSADLDRNEQIDRIEAKSIFNLSDAQVFDKYDTSGEGVITRLEFIEYYRLREDGE